MGHGAGARRGFETGLSGCFVWFLVLSVHVGRWSMLVVFVCVLWPGAQFYFKNISTTFLKLLCVYTYRGYTMYIYYIKI